VERIRIVEDNKTLVGDIFIGLRLCLRRSVADHELYLSTIEVTKTTRRRYTYIYDNSKTSLANYTGRVGQLTRFKHRDFRLLLLFDNWRQTDTISLVKAFDPVSREFRRVGPVRRLCKSEGPGSPVNENNDIQVESVRTT